MATQKQVAEALGISQGRVSQLIKQGMLPPAAYGDHSISSCEYLYAEWQEHLELCFQLAVPNAEIWAFWYERKLYRARYGED
jgi:transcriptional regulator with XRE-family HTH domain